MEGPECEIPDGYSSEEVTLRFNLAEGHPCGHSGFGCSTSYSILKAWALGPPVETKAQVSGPGGTHLTLILSCTSRGSDFFLHHLLGIPSTFPASAPPAPVHTGAVTAEQADTLQHKHLE